MKNDPNADLFRIISIGLARLGEFINNNCGLGAATPINRELLMIEPRLTCGQAVYDEFTTMAADLWPHCTQGEGYFGWHTCVCGQKSDCCDHVTPMGRKTNSLLLHYIRDHREEVPAVELVKLREEYGNLLKTQK